MMLFIWKMQPLTGLLHCDVYDDSQCKNTFKENFNSINSDLYRFLDCAFVSFQLVTQHENIQGTWHGVNKPTNTKNIDFLFS